MSPPPIVALVLLGVWLLAVFAATNAAGYAQWRATDECDASYYAPDGDSALGSNDTACGERSEYASSERVAPVADD